jgi:hypothetical protein
VPKGSRRQRGKGTSALPAPFLFVPIERQWHNAADGRARAAVGGYDAVARADCLAPADRPDGRSLSRVEWTLREKSTRARSAVPFLALALRLQHPRTIVFFVRGLVYPLSPTKRGDANPACLASRSNSVRFAAMPPP